MPLFLLLFSNTVSAQPGKVIETGDNVLDPNLDGFITTSPTGFIGDLYDVDEFEIKMFGIPIFGDGEALNDVQNGQPCGVVDIALDSAGYAIYAGYDDNENLIFRFRLAGDQKSVQSYSILMDTDQLVGAADPNSNDTNPGFEIEITLIQRFGVYIYAIDGEDSCPTPLVMYSVDTHQQKSIAGTESCDDSDIYIDFYVPFSELENLFGITPDTNVRFAGVTNISATCALDGSISDIGGVDDAAYNGCFSCAILDLTENQCPASVSNLCETCAGFPLGATETPTIDLPIIVGDLNISGTAEAEAEVSIELYSGAGDYLGQDNIFSDIAGNWISNDFANPLNFGDSVVVNALLPGKCESGAFDTGLSFAIVSPNQPPVISGSGTTPTYIENDPPTLFAEDITIFDDNSTLQSATIGISANYQQGQDILSLGQSPSGVSVVFDSITGSLSVSGEASVAEYELFLKTIAFENLSDAPSREIRSISFQVNDGTNTSPEYTINLLITQQNDPPVIVVGGDPVDTLYFFTDEDVPIPICIEANDVDLDALAISSTTVVNGTGTVEPDQGLCLIYSPAENINGQESLEITVCDNADPALCDTVIAIINIEPVNDAPIILDGAVATDSVFYSIEQASNLEFCLTGFDIENDDLIIESALLPSASTSNLVWQQGLCFVYQPETTFTGKDYAEIKICDSGTPSRCTIVIVEIVVVDINLPPEITSPATDTLYVEMLKNETAEICIEAIDPDNDVLDFGTITDLLNVNGEATLAYNCLNYTPPQNYVGDVLLKLEVCDDVTPPKCDEVIVKIDVLPVNNAPYVVDNGAPADTVYFSTDMNAPLDLCLDARDPDNDNVSAQTVINDSGSGTFEVNGDLCLIFVPENDVIGDVWATVTICDDGDPLKCTETVVGINITPVNDPPVILFNGMSTDTLEFETFKNQQFEFCIDAVDENGDDLFVDGIEEIQAGGFLQPGGSALCLGFVPDNDFIGEVIQLVTICDSGNPQGCDSVYVKVAVLDINKPPVLLYNNLETDTVAVSTNENTPIEVCIDAVDVDGNDILVENLSLQSGDGDISYTQNAGTYCITYSPALDYFGITYVELGVCDNGQPSLCDNVIIKIEVLNLNNSPEIYQYGAVRDTIRFTTAGRTQLDECVTALDADGDVLAMQSATTTKEGGTISTSNADLCFTYLPADDFLGFDYFDVTVCDDQVPSLCSTVVAEINVVSINQQPRFMYEGNVVDTLEIATVEKKETLLNLELLDSEEDELSLTSSLLKNGQGDLNVELNLRLIDLNYVPDVLSAGNHQIIISVCDNGLPELCGDLVINIAVAQEEIFPFEAISPNNDNLNDFWQIDGIEHYPENMVMIFDRWNNMVFKLGGYNNTDKIWRGESNRGISKADLKDGTYYYKITLTPGGTVISGMVVLKR